MRTFGIIAFGLAAAAGCGDKGDTSAGDSDGGFTLGFTIEGSVVDFWDGTVGGEGLCVTLYDPDALVFKGADLVEIDSVTADADGNFQFTEVTTIPQLGMLMMADDCDGGGAYMGLATGIPSDVIGGMDYGDVLSEQHAYFFPGDRVGTFDADLASAGYSGGSLNDVGALMGWVIDGIDEATAGPVDCATVANTSDSVDVTCYYADTDDTDGIFTTGGAANAETASAANAFYVCPEAPIGLYTATDCTGAEYYSITGGSQPGLAQFLRIPRQ